ncbi:hypothetical protein L1987_19170 [Smallanthus sonchifolius]|uniref:Uncharacterized protein n=1 Tax=Smallanthus sonchifolius TaxID=185202 RepID=A0ACB9J4B2_9ASTR|nr:hypothetical protein L1987_19170 [Smallanthus sonchifolius]
MNPSGGQIPPSKQQPDPRLEVLAVIPSSDCPIIVGSPHLGEDLTAILPLSATNGTGKSLLSTNGVQSRASPYDRSPGGGATRRKGSRRFRRENTQIEDLVPRLDKFSLVCGQDTIPAPQVVKLSVPAVPAVSGSTSGLDPAPPSSALPSRRSTRNANRSASVGEGSDIEAPTGSLVGLGSNQETATRVFEPIVMEKDSERVSGSRPIQRTTRSEMMLKPDLWSETDACMVNKEQYSIPGSNDLSESSSTSVNVMDKSMDKIGDSPPADGSAGKLMAEKPWSAESVASSRKSDFHRGGGFE